MQKLSYAFLGTGGIACDMAKELEKIGFHITSCWNRTKEKAIAFKEKFHLDYVYDNVTDLFNDNKIDAVYVATTHNIHYQYVKEALLHKKHVLCEKAITLNSKELTELCEIAKENHVILMEAMTIYHMPLYKEIEKRLHLNEFGNINFIQTFFGSVKEKDESNRFFNRALGGGALLDLGIYNLSFIRFFSDSNLLIKYSDVLLSKSLIDEQESFIVTNESKTFNALALISLSSKFPKRATVSCEKCMIEFEPYTRCDNAVITWNDGTKEVITKGSKELALTYEVLDFEEAVLNHGNTLIDYTINTMEIMTSLRKKWNVVYPEEEKEK